ncbi:glycosyltransferase [uncultured Barnesiella sp.]|uniref:glycosyltransferase family 4 protein n=1 Tax=uncultured Barnesiella sp. TaxID=584861 RepID=UPI0026277AB8|nr:glycosyltransferase [uncultured Barnesiella sp.]
MKNILVLAYQLSPTKGSEYSVAWNYVIRMSKYNRLTVLYGASGEHLGDCSEMEEFAQTNILPNVTFICIKPSNWTNALNWCNRHNFLNYTFYIAYRSWQKQVYKVVKKLVQNEKFDLIHFVGPIGYREPGYLWKIDLPYIWGPIGGANKASVILLSKSPISAKLKFLIRNLLNELQLKYSLRLKKALTRTDLLLTAISENQKIFKIRFNKNSIYLPENSIATNIYLNTLKFENCTRYRIIVIGRLEAGKVVNILLEALTMIKNKEKVVVDIVGDGPERHSLESFAQKHQLQSIIKWHGKLPREKAIELFNSAHLHVITSAKEGNPTTIWEAMSYGVPTMSFDHCGMHDTICDRCGILIPIHSYEQCVNDLADKIDGLLEHPDRFEQLANGVIECAQKFTWNTREKILLSCYDEAIKNFHNR